MKSVTRLADAADPAERVHPIAGSSASKRSQTSSSSVHVPARAPASPAARDCWSHYGQIVIEIPTSHFRSHIFSFSYRRLSGQGTEQLLGVAVAVRGASTQARSTLIHAKSSATQSFQLSRSLSVLENRTILWFPRLSRRLPVINVSPGSRQRIRTIERQSGRSVCAV
jgi:hypothetical protein